MRGLDVFKAHFKGYEDCYVVIGGTACTLLLDEVGTDFRLTKDFDIVLIVENISPEFVHLFKDFIKLGRYKSVLAESERPKFYRFEKPENLLFPAMIELFSRKPTDFELAPNSHLMPISIADSLVSLSAILLNEDYYNFLLLGRKNISGIMVLDELRLIPFKAKAWCELTDLQNEGVEGLTKHIKKHRKDIAILLTLISNSSHIQLEGSIEQDMIRFVNAMKMKVLDEYTTGVRNMTTELYCSRLKEIYNL